DKRLVLAQIGKPHSAALCSAGGLRGAQGQRSRRVPVVASKKLRVAVIRIRYSARTRWRNPAATRPIRHACVTVVVLPAEGDPLLGHVIEGERRIPGFEGVPGISRKVGRVDRRGGGSLAIDGRKQDQIASWVVDLSTADG